MSEGLQDIQSQKGGKLHLSFSVVSCALFFWNMFRRSGGRWRPSIHVQETTENVVGQEIKMPALSPTMTEGKIIQWLKKVGEPIKPGDALCEIQTDKAVMVFETEEDGILAKILIGDNNDVKVGSLIGLMVSPGEDWKEVEAPTNDKIIDIKKSSLVEDIPPFVEC
ncbi:hypothetical protein AAG570_013249 [Ranatra chinensis]|uniref:Lipoyl-binding domain-containing protein n=1 Tax=Ranatra chinensis TaxID=642074 RepID=A0ABD0YGI3_9HEMI